EPKGAPSLVASMEAGRVVELENIDKFVDGAAVKRVGDLTFEICGEALHEVLLVPEGRACSVILQLYNDDAMVTEPAGALSVAALEDIKDEIKGKNVVVIISGGNNDIHVPKKSWNDPCGTKGLNITLSSVSHKERVP